MGQKWPALQAVHSSVVPSGEKVPASHGTGSLLFSGHRYPPGHPPASAQFVLPPAPDLQKSSGHATILTPSGQVNPEGHTVQ